MENFNDIYMQTVIKKAEDVQYALKYYSQRNNLLEKQVKNLQEMYDNRVNEYLKYKEYYEEMEEVNKKFISKEKIKNKMNEIMNYTFSSKEEINCQNYAYDRLKELLEE